MSAAAEYFYRGPPEGAAVRKLFIACIRIHTHAYPESPVSVYGDDEVCYVDDKHDSVDVTHRTVFWVDDVIEELPYG